MARGFIYLLGNPAMPGYYKIGRTINAPGARAAALSSATGVPLPFQVLCFISTAEVKLDEAEFHRIFEDYRVSHNREFFYFGADHLPWVWGMFRHYPWRLNFCEGEQWDALDMGFTEVNPWRMRQRAPDDCRFAPDDYDMSPEVVGHLRLVG